jgi:hypothetical protein
MPGLQNKHESGEDCAPSASECAGTVGSWCAVDPSCCQRVRASSEGVYVACVRGCDS